MAEKATLERIENSETNISFVDHDLKEKDVKLDYSGAHEKSSPEEIRLVKKLDWWIMPTLWLMFWLNYLDRNAIALARLNDLEEDLNLKSTEYQTCVSILFVGYLVGQIPSNMILTRVRPSYWLSLWMAVWAIVSALTALAHNYTGLLLTRLFLGVTEAPYYPGALYLLSAFYTRKEVATRISILYTGNIIATAFAGLIAAGVFDGLDKTRGIAGWQWLFILQGAVTFMVALGAVFTLPDNPLTTRWLTPEERQTLGFNTTITLVLTCPPYLIAGLTSIFWSISSGRFNERTWHITVAKIIAIAGFVTGCATLNTGVRYFAMFVFTIGTYAVNSIILGWVGSTCGQTQEKKASAYSIVNSVANVSFIWTPYLWPESDEPRYAIAMGSSAGFSLACMLAAWGMRWNLKWLNGRLRRSDNERTLFYVV
ncbi:MFS transporter [Lasiodiplodia theobromae]|uniref:MFS transporter n=1 Tax=Lasiodiplodia theobromae TaxID=45133 RepID=UPI0015C30545|nr:MFS transporter [Lasiodiplodia theobromae]KAF4538226.1 MFS transporter [Lasiodiplodia theobromae]